MRLKHRQHAFAPGRFRGRERRANFGRMMRVIVDQQKAIALVFDFETAAGVLEIARAMSRSSRTEFRVRVASAITPSALLHIVLARHVQNGFAQFFAALKTQKTEAKSCSSMSVPR